MARISVFVALALLTFQLGAARGALITVTAHNTVTFTGPPSTTTQSFNVAGFDNMGGTRVLKSVGIDLFDDVPAGGVQWQLQNQTASTISNANYNQAISLRLLRGDNNAQLISSGGSSTTFQFSVAPGQTVTRNFDGLGGGVGGSASAANRPYFDTAGNVALKLENTGITLSNFAPLTLLTQSGSRDGATDLTLTYRYQKTQASATPIVISSNTTGTLAAAQVDWYVFQYATGALTIDTLGSTLSTNDTEIALFSGTGARIAQNDDISTGNTLSQLTFANGALTPGTYYIAVGAFNSTFGTTGFTIDSTSDYTGTYQLNLTGTPVPEPTMLALAGALLLLPQRRRHL